MKKSPSRIDYLKSFNKQLKKTPLSIKIAFRQRLELLRRDQLHPQLNNHSLTGKYKDYRSINISGDWKAIYSEDKNTVIFEPLGTHNQLYK